jgi:hypothetical protein
MIKLTNKKTIKRFQLLGNKTKKVYHYSNLEIWLSYIIFALLIYITLTYLFR